MRQVFIILALFCTVSCKNNLDVNKLLSERIEILDKDNKLYLKKFEQKYAQNYVKTKPFFDRAFYIRKVIDTLITEINNTNTFESRIYNKLNNCFDTILSFYWSKDKDEYLSMYEKTLVFTNDYKNDEKFKSKLFLQYDLKLIRNEIIRYLYSQIDKYDYKFNLLEPVVLADRKVLKLGEIYSAKIIISASDTNTYPNFEVDGELLDVWNGMGQYNVKTNKRGKFEWKGIMKYFNPTTEEYEEFPFSSSYVVK